MAFIPYYILILAGTIIIDYFAGILIENAKTKRDKKLFLIISLFANIGILVVFKYYNFFLGEFENAMNLIGVDNHIPYLSLVLPIGLSFHTFQAMSYTIEIYRGNFKAERHFGIYALYVMFYPQLVAGPIERPQNILPQLYKKNDIEYGRIASGLKLMLWGFFKKIVIADRLAMLVNFAYNSPQEYDGISLLLATYFFAFQIYCDFSGYSDIAIGAAKVMGYDLMENFRTPYAAQSVKEFWERWHISLSSWFRDYLYIPLGGNRVTKWRWYYNLLIVFLISGLWHGANITFVIWGTLHGCYLIVALIFTRKIQKTTKRTNALSRALKTFFTFNLVAFAWIFFRAGNLQEAQIIINKIFSFNLYHWDKIKMMGDIKLISIAITFLLLAAFISVDPFMDKVVKSRVIITKPKSMLIFSTIFIVILMFGFFGKTDFIYFQF
jgi:D-alanyl-lipoteichoic acid acyltransferase DltB (MBOAT superfamily)